VAALKLNALTPAREYHPLVSFWWQHGVVVTVLGVSSKLLYVGPVSTAMGDHLLQANHLSISPSHPGQLSLLSLAGLEMSTSQSVVMVCGWGVQACMVSVGGR